MARWGAVSRALRSRTRRVATARGRPRTGTVGREGKPQRRQPQGLRGFLLLRRWALAPVRDRASRLAKWVTSATSEPAPARAWTPGPAQARWASRPVLADRERGRSSV